VKQRKPTQEPIELVLGDPQKDHLEFHLVATWDGIAAAEQILDRSLVFGIRTKDLNHPTIALVRALFYGETREHHPEMTWEEARDLVTRDNFADVAGKVVAAWLASMAKPKGEAAADEDPTRDRSETRASSGSRSGATLGSISA
jgi:hypothetical protein